MKQILIALMTAALLMLGGCAGTRDQLAQWIGPSDADAVMAWAEAVKDRIETAAQSEAENLRLELEIAEAKARLKLAEARAQLLDAADKAEAEAQAALAREALKQIEARLSGAAYHPRDRPRPEPMRPVRWVVPA